MSPQVATRGKTRGCYVTSRQSESFPRWHNNSNSSQGIQGGNARVNGPLCTRRGSMRENALTRVLVHPCLFLSVVDLVIGRCSCGANWCVLNVYPCSTVLQAGQPKKITFLQTVLTDDVSPVVPTMTHRGDLQISARLQIHLAFRSDKVPSNEIPNYSQLRSAES